MQTISSLPDSEPLSFQEARFIKPGSKRVFHGFFTRRGGMSEGIYKSLNCGPGSGDDPESVHKNREIVARTAGVDPGNLLSTHQVHSADCVMVKEPWAVDKRPKADAMVTDRPGLALGVLTADCAPVLFFGEKPDGAPVIGAAHAGWKGALDGVLEAAVRTMTETGAAPETLRAAIGPCIARRSYEVGPEFQMRFMEQARENEQFFAPARRKDHYLFDLAGYCAARLAMAGVKNVNLTDQDTYADEERFFSYRRSVHRARPDYGRQISVISIF